MIRAINALAQLKATSLINNKKKTPHIHPRSCCYLLCPYRRPPLAPREDSAVVCAVYIYIINSISRPCPSSYKTHILFCMKCISIYCVCPVYKNVPLCVFRDDKRGEWKTAVAILLYRWRSKGKRRICMYTQNILLFFVFFVFIKYK